MNFSSVLLEIGVAALGLLILVIGPMFAQEKKGYLGYFSAFILLCILILSFVFKSNMSASFYEGIYVNDSMSLYFKQVFIIGAIMVTLMSVNYIKGLTDSRSEFFAIILFAALGMMCVSSSGDLITLYVSMELMSISFIILTSYEKKNIKSSEAGMKYVLLNAISSAVLLYGMSFFYGIYGSVDFKELISTLNNGNEPLILLASILMLAGFAFKISAVPFHMWSPDVYEGAPSPVTAFLAVGSKAAAFSALIRIMTQVLNPAFNKISVLIIGLAVLSMIVGNLTAIPQKNIKRMLAYSGISHAGYILLGLIAHTEFGISAMLYYLMLYMFANVGAFASITAFINSTGREDIQDLSGMWKRSPFLSSVLLISLLSLAGIPPAAGFIGKFYLFSEVVKQGYIWLAFLAMAMSVVSIYYYITVIKTMIMGEPEGDERINIPPSLKIVMAVSLFMILAMGIYPGPITDWTLTVAALFF
ncbi:NADH-quinone oxidoreductase subunit N [Oxobacter pfennigii]|uniref:NADH-quinone oxidoreductase subunit N n=1 Tax=Oxobacter pfennigii TaxID=36849 RepID=A0A0P8X5J0_9CLOT|nr:NADH-quinone oxidoreductase subunit N [Oxobacter pfennigii]KPU46093.1 NADH-quinone oxidoreductase subunit N [Oxobacter pfennigii]